jgi:hypothetical protein
MLSQLVICRPVGAAQRSWVNVGRPYTRLASHCPASPFRGLHILVAPTAVLDQQRVTKARLLHAAQANLETALESRSPSARLK